MRYPLTSDRLRIEPLRLSDAESFVLYRQDPEVAKYQGWDSSYSLQQGLDLITSQQGVELPEVGDWIQLGVYDRATGELLGDVGLKRLEDQGWFEIGFTIATRYQSKGYAKSAVEVIVQSLFADRSAVGVVAQTDARNRKAQQLLNGLGFQNKPNRQFEEFFKGEQVRVDYFELQPGGIVASSHPIDRL